MRQQIFRGVFLACLLTILTCPAFSKDDDKNLSKAYGFYLKGLIADHYSEPDKALKQYLNLKNLDNSSISARIQIAVDYIKINEYDKAIEVLEEAKKLDSESLDVYILLVLIYTAQGKNDLASKEYEVFLNRAYALEPENIKVIEYLAQFKLKKTQYDEAKLLYERIVKEKPDYVDAYFWLGYISEETSQREQAVSYWKKALDLDPEQPDVLNSLGYVYAENGENLDEAEAMVKKALSIYPGNPAYLDSLGWVYYKKGDLEQALTALTNASSVLKDGVIFDHLGDVYHSLGEIDKAVEKWEDALSIGGIDKEKMLEKIKKAKDGTKKF